MGGIASAIFVIALLILTPLVGQVGTLQQADPQTEIGMTTAEIENQEGIEVAEGSILAIGHNALFTASIGFPKWSLTRIEIDESEPEKSVIELRIDLSDMHTPYFWLPPVVSSPFFLDVERYPMADVRITEIRPVDIMLSGVGVYSGLAELGIRGERHQYEFVFEIFEAAPVKAEGLLVIRRSDYGMGQAVESLNIFGMEDEIAIAFRFTLPARIEQPQFRIFGDSR